MQAMILAAGIGTRLLPHTLVRPKPLFPILNQPLLCLTIKRLQNLGFDHIVVNCHHLRDQIVDVLDGWTGVIIQEEDVILGTGGGLRKALKHLRDEPLLVSNGDIYHTVNLLELYKYHMAGPSTATLAMHNYPRFNSVTVKNGQVVSFDNRTNSSRLAFTGLHVIEPSLLAGIEDDSFSCIIDRYRQLLDGGRAIGCFRVDDCYWTDMGTVDDYLALHHGLLTDAIPCWQELGQVGKPYCITEKANFPPETELGDWACIGNAHIAKGVQIERVVIWDEVEVSRGSRLADVIVSTDYRT